MACIVVNNVNFTGLNAYNCAEHDVANISDTFTSLGHAVNVLTDLAYGKSIYFCISCCYLLYDSQNLFLLCLQSHQEINCMEDTRKYHLGLGYLRRTQGSDG